MADLLSWAPKPLRRSVMWLVAALIIGYLLITRSGCRDRMPPSP
jgi:hypothetical protein